MVNGETSRQRRHQINYPGRQQARAAVYRAVRAGRLPAPDTVPCVDCGGPAAEYDHWHGYDKEHYLDVQPVCVACHGKRPRSACVPREETRGGGLDTGIRNNIGILMGERHFSVLRIAKETGIKHSALMAIWHGTATQIDRETLDRLCTFLGVTTQELLEWRPDGAGA